MINTVRYIGFNKVTWNTVVLFHELMVYCAGTTYRPIGDKT